VVEDLLVGHGSVIISQGRDDGSSLH
jgi:hypothetical protein